MSSVTEDDWAIGDALHDAVRLHVAGDTVGAGMAAIRAVKADPILTTGILAAKCAHAVHAYARATGMDPVAAYDVLWSMPAASDRS